MNLTDIHIGGQYLATFVDKIYGSGYKQDEDQEDFHGIVEVTSITSGEYPVSVRVITIIRERRIGLRQNGQQTIARPSEIKPLCEPNDILKEMLL